MITVCSLLIRLDGGGAERVAAILAPEFESLGIDFRRLAIDPALLGEESDDSATLLDKPARNQVLRTFSAVFRLRRYLTTNPTDILHLNCEAPDVIGLLTCLTIRRSRRPQLIRTEHTMMPWKKYPRMGKLIPKLLSIVGCRTISCYEDNHSGQNAITIRNPVVVEKNRILPDLGKRIYIVGRLMPSKRVDWILQAADRAQLEVPIVIVGDGPARTDLEIISAKLNLSVQFAGFRSDAWSLMGSEDIFVTASSFEGEPLTLLESMGYEMSVLVSRIPGHQNLLNEHSGYFDSVEELASLMVAAFKADNMDAFRVNQTLSNEIISKRRPSFIANKWASEYRRLLEFELESETHV